MSTKAVIVRHGQRLDKVDPQWADSAPVPYDPPLSDYGARQAERSGNALNRVLKSDEAVIIHSSPFLRCVQTAFHMASHLRTKTPVIIRLDAVFSEWLCPDYFNYSIPPNDSSASLVLSSLLWLRKQSHKNITIDVSWNPQLLGSAGLFNESWSDAQRRFANGWSQLDAYYMSHSPSPNLNVVIVTHGAGCNATSGSLVNKPLFAEFKQASLTIASRIHVNEPWNINALAEPASFIASSDFNPNNIVVEGSLSPKDLSLPPLLTSNSDSNINNITKLDSRYSFTSNSTDRSSISPPSSADSSSVSLNSLTINVPSNSHKHTTSLPNESPLQSPTRPHSHTISFYSNFSANDNGSSSISSSLSKTAIRQRQSSIVKTILGNSLTNDKKLFVLVPTLDATKNLYASSSSSSPSSNLNDTPWKNSKNESNYWFGSNV